MWSGRLTGWGELPLLCDQFHRNSLLRSCERSGLCGHGRDHSNPASMLPCECLFSPFLPRASSSGPWAQRPPPVWPVTLLAAGQRPAHHPPAACSCLLSGEDAVSALARLREHHRGSFHQRAMSGDWEGMQCPSACGHKDPLSLLPRQPSLDWQAEGLHSGRFLSFLLKYGRDWGQARQW